MKDQIGISYWQRVSSTGEPMAQFMTLREIGTRDPKTGKTHWGSGIPFKAGTLEASQTAHTTWKQAQIDAEIKRQEAAKARRAGKAQAKRENGCTDTETAGADG